MPRIRNAVLALLAMVALATACAFAATSPPPPPNEPGANSPRAERDWRDDDDDNDGDWHGQGYGHRHFHGKEGGGMGMRERRMAFRAANSPAASVLRDVAGLERMYRRSGREKEVPGLWRDVLARTSDPVVRHVAGGRLARLEWQAGNKDAAIDQMKRNLDADLKRTK